VRGVRIPRRFVDEWRIRFHIRATRPFDLKTSTCPRRRPDGHRFIPIKAISRSEIMDSHHPDGRQGWSVDSAENVARTRQRSASSLEVGLPVLFSEDQSEDMLSDMNPAQFTLAGHILTNFGGYREIAWTFAGELLEERDAKQIFLTLDDHEIENLYSELSEAHAASRRHGRVPGH
jgi:hypothetical protein